MLEKLNAKLAKMTLFELMVTPKKGSESSENPTERLHPFLWMGLFDWEASKGVGEEEKKEAGTG